MTYTIADLVAMAQSTTKLVRGQWVPSRPIEDDLRGRISSAWMVLRGRADAVVWPEG